MGLDIGPRANIPREASSRSVGRSVFALLAIDREATLKMTALFTETTSRADASIDNASSQNEAMIWIPGGTFRMGSDKHYPEEAPAHRVTVDGFWMDRYPVTNRQFRKFVKATGTSPSPRLSLIQKTIPECSRIWSTRAR